jgi:hypothetical protein
VKVLLRGVIYYITNFGILLILDYSSVSYCP